MKQKTNKILEDKLWSNFEEFRNFPKRNKEYVKARNELIEHYYYILEDISFRLSHKLKLTAEEISSYGVDGLMHSIESFDKEKGVKFKTWASIRIRGSVIDNIRKADWVPRLVRQRHSKLEEVKNKIESIYGNATSSEIAEELGVDIEDYEDFFQKSTPITQFSMNAKPGGENNSEYNEIGDIIEEAVETSPDTALLREELYKKLLGKNFTRPERQIVYLHYYENLTMKEIAERTGFSESRISQMHADIINRLKKKIERNPVYANDLQRLFES